MNKSNIEDISFVNSRNRINKSGQLGSSVITMYRVLLIIIISIIVLGISSLVYSHQINIRDSEAMILVREISGCVISEGVVDLDKLKTGQDIFEYCGFGEDEMERFFILVKVEVDGEEIFSIDGGDSGLSWVRDIFKDEKSVERLKRYEPGNFVKEYSVSVLDGGVEKNGNVFVEVIANAEEN